MTESKEKMHQNQTKRTIQIRKYNKTILSPFSVTSDKSNRLNTPQNFFTVVLKKVYLHILSF